MIRNFIWILLKILMITENFQQSSNFCTMTIAADVAGVPFILWDIIKITYHSEDTVELITVKINLTIKI